MLLDKVYVFIQADFKSGTSQKTGQPYEIRQLKVADPLTFENLQFSYSEKANFNHLNKGDKVNLDIDFKSNFNRDSSVLVLGAFPVK